MKTRAFFLGLLILHLVPPCCTGDELEHEVKAEFIERFTRFVEWPENAGRADDSFVIGVIGDSMVVDQLEGIVADRQVAGRRAVLRRLEDPDQIRFCHLLYISSSGANNLGEILEEAANRPILTVSDTAGFCEQGVMINLYREGQHVRFEVNKDAVDRSGLHVSSNLLRLARLVDGQ